MFGSLVYYLSVTLLIVSLWLTECHGQVLSPDEAALVFAARKQNWDEMIAHAKKGVNVDVEQNVIPGSDRSYLISPLKLAINEADAKVVEELINAGVENKVNQRIKSGDKGTKEELIKEEGAKWLNRKEDFPISDAVFRGDEDIFKILVKHGADVNAHNTHGQSALHKAAEKGNVVAVKALIDLGAELEEKDKDGFTPLELAENKIKAAEEPKKDPAKELAVSKIKAIEQEKKAYQEFVDVMNMIVDLLRNAIKDKKSRKQAADAARTYTHSNTPRTKGLRDLPI
ncbi:ankyrin repeats (many copies) domain-containing protein [Ditylenchus destructor]|uniref:Ankyrin repeats (Many copies) domain-containing protein n=1 Tax=Ditylenchus destructor TaxID=166010 RepID=A0AAD4QRY5_9BILA|nr:ankyrin repeats (many copies) domain-containing protein [Ditylenchus destructor]